MAKQNKLLTGRPLTIEEAYEARPRLWWVYTLIVLIVASLLTWSGTAVKFGGFATKGIEVAKGVGNGLLHPDTNLLFNLTTEGVPYQLFQTVAIAVLGTLIGGLLAVPFSFLASDKIVPKGVAFITSAVTIAAPPSLTATASTSCALQRCFHVLSSIQIQPFQSVNLLIRFREFQRHNPLLFPQPDLLLLIRVHQYCV